MRQTRLFRRIVGRLRHYANYFRREWRLANSREWQGNPALLQPWPFTRADRHPEFFMFIQRCFAEVARPRLLSFGCSTGEEVFALAEMLPHADVEGIDINPACVAKARRKAGKDMRSRVAFYCGDTIPDVAESYDAIFCLSVLRHARLDDERPVHCTEVMSFTRFERVVRDADFALKPGGFLIIWGSNFRFSDTPYMASYDLVPVPQKKPERGAFYGRDDQLLAIDQTDQWVFQKRKAITGDLDQ
jgi:SAM-dependent methyltransferase